MNHLKLRLSILGALFLNQAVGAAHGTDVIHSAVKPDALAASDPHKTTVNAGAQPADISVTATGQSPQMEQGTTGAVNQIGNDESKLIQQQQGGVAKTAAGTTDILHGEKQFGAGENIEGQQQQDAGTTDTAKDQPGADEVALKQADDAGTVAAGTFS
ncbi:MAG: hypothetical protein WC444_01160 [Candidatus Paceibacterota bacterium]